jgi:DNA-binding phage protein
MDRDAQDRLAKEQVFTDYYNEVGRALVSMIEQAEDKGMPAGLTIAAIAGGLAYVASQAGLNKENVFNAISTAWVSPLPTARDPE